MIRNYILEVPHDEASDWGGHEFVDVLPLPSFTPDKPRAYRAIDGSRRGGSTVFHRWVCNNPDCPGRLLVRANHLSDIVNAEWRNG